jgi:hypothetical protein
VVVGLPPRLTSELVQQVTAGLLDRVEIRLSDLHVHKDDDVEVKAGLLGKLKPGHFVLDLQLQEVSAVLHTGTPTVGFQGSSIAMSAPVGLEQGKGNGTLTFDWNSQGLGAVLCEDFKVHLPVAGTVRPHTIPLKGTFALELRDGVVVATPRFPDLTVHLSVVPSAATWAALDKAVEQRRWACEKVAHAVDVHALVQGLLDKGFDVKVPSRVLKPVRLSAAVRQTVSLEGQSYSLVVKPVDLKVTDQMLWYGANVTAWKPVPSSPSPTAR